MKFKDLVYKYLYKYLIRYKKIVPLSRDKRIAIWCEFETQTSDWDVTYLTERRIIARRQYCILGVWIFYGYQLVIPIELDFRPFDDMLRANMSFIKNYFLSI